MAYIPIDLANSLCRPQLNIFPSAQRTSERHSMNIQSLGLGLARARQVAQELLAERKDCLELWAAYAALLAGHRQNKA